MKTVFQLTKALKLMPKQPMIMPSTSQTLRKASNTALFLQFDHTSRDYHWKTSDWKSLKKTNHPLLNQEHQFSKLHTFLFHAAPKMPPKQYLTDNYLYKNKEGLCNGYSVLYTYYVSKGLGDVFLNRLRFLSVADHNDLKSLANILRNQHNTNAYQQDSEYFNKLEQAKDLESYISALLFAQNPKILCPDINQVNTQEILEFISPSNSPYNMKSIGQFAYQFTKEQLCRFLNELKIGDIALIVLPGHAAHLSKHDNGYHFYDSNIGTEPKTLKNVESIYHELHATIKSLLSLNSDTHSTPIFFNLFNSEYRSYTISDFNRQMNDTRRAKPETNSKLEQSFAAFILYSIQFDNSELFELLINQLTTPFKDFFILTDFPGTQCIKYNARATYEKIITLQLYTDVSYHAHQCLEFNRIDLLKKVLSKIVDPDTLKELHLIAKHKQLHNACSLIEQKIQTQPKLIHPQFRR